MEGSRAKRYRSRRRNDSEVSRFWIMGLLFSLLVLAFEFFIEIPADADWLIDMEMALFSASFTLLAFYLLGLTFAFSRHQKAGKINHQIIIYVWLGAILFHLFLLISNLSNQHVYKAGIILFLGPLFLTVYHFITYLAALREEREEQEAATTATLERTAYQMILEGGRVYSELSRLKTEYPEVEQMLRANDFHDKLERYALEMQQYLQAKHFERKDVELLEGHYYFLENLLSLANQHPGIIESRVYSRRGDN
ncbi:hypothetical protein [Brevibacillus sp. DP1.3A]|uniref:hypothetical protein n=1 Tax=unclassified Brevibacillus TaxID=2684853 RepID=UPI00156AB532|nr:hypothetical protein [Brevibacillus sp. DP1.3A]MED1914781.1 hypothetical protein [Bacillus thuringiensis]UED76609.1 hypothetical protein HP399_008990 [Brevibacillus sp. DP1.3A]